MATKNGDAVKYRIMRLQPDGSRVEHQLLANEAGFKLRSIVDGGLQASQIDAGTLAEALAATPELLLVGTGFTDIDVLGIDTHELLGMLVVDDPAAKVPEPSDWGPADEEGELRTKLPLPQDWDYDEEILSIRAQEGYEIVPRLLWINGERTVVLRGPENFAAVGLLDDDWRHPNVTRDLLSWGFYNETGGPCTFDGGATLGWVGPDLWGFVRWGDHDPLALLVRAPAPEQRATALAEWIAGEEWGLQYLLSAVGMPGLDQESAEELMSLDDVQGDMVASHLDDALDAQVLQILIDSSDALAEAADGLRDPDSPRGRKIYAELQRILDGDPSGSWFDVHEAMTEIVVPHMPVVPIAELPGALKQEVEAALAGRTERELERETQRITQLRVDVEAARGVLGVEGDEQPSLGSVRKLTASHPEDEARYMQAFWAVRDWQSMGGADAVTAQLDTLNAQLESVRGRTQRAEAEAWPKTWPTALHQLWVRLGGTSDAARAWADAGWEAETVLTSDRLGDYWNPPILDRVKLTNVPTQEDVKSLTEPPPADWPHR